MKTCDKCFHFVVCENLRTYKHNLERTGVKEALDATLCACYVDKDKIVFLPEFISNERIADCIVSLSSATANFMNTIASNPDLIKRLFEERECKKSAEIFKEITEPLSEP